MFNFIIHSLYNNAIQQNTEIRVQYKIELQFQLTRIQSSVHSNSDFDRAICHARFGFFSHQINVAHDPLLTMQPQNPLLHDVQLCTENMG
jgi:hypothetical protein